MISRLSILFVLCSLMSFSQSRQLDRDSLLLDINYLEAIMTSAHPGIYRYNSKESFKKIFYDLRASLTETISEEDWMLMLAQAVKKIKCGHTYVNPWNMDPEIRQRIFGKNIFLPVAFDLVDNTFIITHNYSNNKKIKRGDKIISMNNIPVGDIINKLQTIAKHDGNNTNSINRYLSLDEFGERRWEAFDLYFYLFYKNEETITLEIESFQGSSKFSSDIRLLSKNERAEKSEGMDKGKSWYSKLDGENFYMKLGTFAIWNWKDFDYKKWYSEQFETIKTKNIQNLIIDIRGNEGGLGEVREELMSYLTKNPIPCSKDKKVLTRTIKLDRVFEPFSETWSEFIFNGLPEKEYTIFNSEFFELNESRDCSTILPKENAFTNNIYILGDGSNVSATFRLLEQLEDFENVFFVGTTTGGNRQGINGGEYIFFRMPYSKMEVDIPLKYFYGGKDRKDEGIHPDYIALKSQKSISNNQDVHLNLVNNLIESRHKITETYILSLLDSNHWRGELMYLDYQTNKIVKIPTNLEVNLKDDFTALTQYKYPDEPHMDAAKYFKIDLKGGMIEGRKIVDITQNEGRIIITAEVQGYDDNQEVDLRFKYTFGEDIFAISKEFKKSNKSDYTIRHVYVFNR